MVVRSTVSRAVNTSVRSTLGSGGGASGGGGPSYDVDAQAYFTAVEAEDGEALESGVKDAINAFVVGCKDDGIWTWIKASCILAGARTLDGALVPLVGTAPTSVNFVSGDYSRTAGLTGNGSTKRIDTNFTFLSARQNNRHAATYVTSRQTGATYAYFGSSSALNEIEARTQLLSPVANNTTLVSRLADQTSNTSAAGKNANGFMGLSRSTSGSYTRRANAGDETISVSSLAGDENMMCVFKRNSTGSTLETSSTIAFYSFGDALTLALLDTRVSTLITAIGAALA